MPKINHEKIALYLEKLVAGWDEELAREMIENLPPDERVHLSRLLDICRKENPPRPDNWPALTGGPFLLKFLFAKICEYMR